MAGAERRGAAGGAPQRPAGEGEGERAANRIRVSNSARPLFFYVNLARRYLAEHDEVVVSALGVATATAVTVVEVLKNKVRAPRSPARAREPRGRPAARR